MASPTFSDLSGPSAVLDNQKQSCFPQGGVGALQGGGVTVPGAGRTLNHLHPSCEGDLTDSIRWASGVC